LQAPSSPESLFSLMYAAPSSLVRRRRTLTGRVSCYCSTLFKLIAGLEQPDQGALTVGDSVKVMYVDQNRLALKDGR
jgi:ATPase subunit of ABC transporter with duplicated ATPase domains